MRSDNAIGPSRERLYGRLPECILVGSHTVTIQAQRRRRDQLCILHPPMTCFQTTVSCGCWIGDPVRPVSSIWMMVWRSGQVPPSAIARQVLSCMLRTCCVVVKFIVQASKRELVPMLFSDGLRGNAAATATAERVIRGEALFGARLDGNNCECSASPPRSQRLPA